MRHEGVPTGLVLVDAPPALNGDRLWTDGKGNFFTGANGTIRIDTRPGAVNYDAIDERGCIKPPYVACAAEIAAAGGAEHHPYIDDDESEGATGEHDGHDLATELGDEYDVHDGNGGSYAGLEFIGDVGRDPFNPGVND